MISFYSLCSNRLISFSSGWQKLSECYRRWNYRVWHTKGRRWELPLRLRRTVVFNRTWGTEGPDRLRHIWTGRQHGLQKRLCWVSWSIHHGWWSWKNIWLFWSNPDRTPMWKYKAELDTESGEYGLGSVREWQKLYHSVQGTQSFF